MVFLLDLSYFTFVLPGREGGQLQRPYRGWPGPPSSLLIFAGISRSLFGSLSLVKYLSFCFCYIKPKLKANDLKTKTV